MTNSLFSSRSTTVLLTAAVLAFLALAGSARADFGFAPGSFSATLTDAQGAPQQQAGAHPDLTVGFVLDTALDGFGHTTPDESLNDLGVTLPPGLLGDPQATAKCAHRDFQVGHCDRQTMVGVDTFRFSPYSFVPPIDAPVAVYNLAPPPGVAARLGFQVTAVSVIVDARVQSDGSYNLSADVDGLSTGLEVFANTLTLWGVPADHNGAGPNPFYPSVNPLVTNYGGPGPGPRKPFMDNPTRCGVPLAASVRADSWQHPDRYVTAQADITSGLSGCDALSFAPSVSVQPASPVAGAPSGYTVEVDVPQPSDPDGLIAPHLKDATIALPAGVAISPAAASGLGACSDDQLAVHSLDEDTCPANAAIGTVRIDSPLLAGPMTGHLYQGTQLSNDPASGAMYRLFLTAEGSGVRIKLRGAVKADPVTGQITATFLDNPQLPFSKMTLAFDDGARAPLTTPDGCGSFTTTTAFSSWGGQSVAPSSVFATDQGCGHERTFAPGLSAGTTNVVAAQHTSFVLRVTDDGGAAVSTVKTVLPKGLLADLKDTPRCAEPQAAVGACPAATQIGTTTVGAGEGSSPVYLPMAGKAPTAVYLGGPYKGAPLSLSIVVPAQAGPFDLGVVVVRAALSVDPSTAQATVVSDPLPTIVGGVPLHLRDIDVDITKPDFMVNPTNCDTTAVAATITSADGQAVDGSSRFQTTGCSELPLQPRLELGLSGRGQTTDDKHPALSARLTQAPGQSNIKQVKVTLPLSLALDPDNANGLCEPADAAADKCPASTIVGSVKAQSPILDGQLSGPVYFVRGERIDPKSGRTIKTLPKLYVPLTASDYPGLKINLNAGSEVVDDHLVTTFDDVPDAPISSFDLTIAGGAHGILVVSGADLCKDTQIADQAVTGQSGKLYQSTITMSTPCGLGVVQSGHTSTALNVMIGGIGAGKLSVSGTGLRATSRKIKAATTATLRVPLTAAGRTALAEHRNIKVAVTVRFTPTGKKATKIVKHLIIHGEVKR